jgi:uncharacterized protein YjbJ (UPF0337 family)
MKDKVTGKAEEIKGRVTGDRSEELKGKARQAKGRISEALMPERTTHRRDFNDPA